MCRAVRQRIQKRGFVTKRVNLAIDSLNSLFYGGGKRFKPWCTGDIGVLPLNQRDALKSIVQSIKAFGAPPPNASCSEALRALRAISDGYTNPEPGVGSVCNMILQQLSLPSGKVAGVELSAVLDEPLRSMVCNFEDWMMLDGDRWAMVANEAHSVRTYNDPSLYDHQRYLKFLKHLHKCGILGLVSNCRGRVGAFTVTKKPKFVDGKRVDRQRLILDCRAINYAFKDPPHTRLGSLAALTELELPSEEKLFVAGSDIQDCFYAAKLPKGMEECFCLHKDLSREDAVEVFGADFGQFSHLSSFIPCITVLPMGFSWSFYIIQQLHEQASIRALGISPYDLIKDGNPPPELRKGHVFAMPYCDNVHCLSTSRELADEGKRKIAEELQSMGFSLHEDEEANTYFQTLGGVIDGETGAITPTKSRAWNCILAFGFLLDNVVSGKLVQQLIGHSVVIFVLNRCGMCTFRHLYDFVQSGCAPRRLRPGEREEVKNFIGLVPLLVGNIRLEWSDTVTCTDASPIGYGICERRMDTQEIRSMGRWQERWRFKHLDPAHWKPRDRAQGRDVLGDVRTARAFPVYPDFNDLYMPDGEFPEVPAEVVDPTYWKTVLMGRWSDTKEHITLKEGRTLVLAARRLTRSSNSRGKRHLILVDNLALAMCSCKGRATNYSMLRVTQQLGALSLAGGFSLRLRWVPSERNPSDGPSRGQIRPGTYQAPWSDRDVETHIQPGAGLQKGHAGSGEWQQSEEGNEGSVKPAEQEEGFSYQTACSNETYSSSQDSGQSLFFSAGTRPPCSRQQTDCFGETISEQSYRGAVWELLPEVSEFLPGTRARLAPFSKHRCQPSRLHGRAVLRGEAHERRGEDLGKCGVPSRITQRKARPVQKGSAWVAQRASSREQGSLAQTGRVRFVHDSLGKGEAPACSEAHSGFRHLHEAGRESRFAEEELSGSSFKGWTPVQMVCNSDQGLRRASPRQSGNLRQQHPSEQSGADLDRRRPASACENSSKEGFKDLPFRCSRFQTGDECGRGTSAACGVAPISTPSWRSSRRLECKGARPSRCEEPREVADGPVSTPVHEGGKDPADFEPTLTCKSGVLSLVTPQPVQGLQRKGSSEAKLDPLTVDVFSCNHKPHRFALEIFAGTARVSSALCSQGIATFPIDICLFPSHDVLDRLVERKLSFWIRKQRVSFVWLGMPCTTFSRARKHDGLGPGPLRDSDHLWGLPNLNKSDRKKLALGNALFRFTIRILELCERWNIPYALENPATSMAWEMQHLQRFCKTYDPNFCHLDFCQFGERWKKPTTILYNHCDLSPLNKQCSSLHGICSRTSRPHVRLAGVDHDNVFMTLRAQPYPFSMAALVGRQVASALQG